MSTTPTEKKNTFKRRDFVKAAGLGAAGFFIVPRHVLGRGYISPSDKLNVALIGAGGRANSHRDALKDTENLVAFCDVDDARAKATYEMFPKVPHYRDFRKMLDAQDKQIDAVVITTPDHTHAVAAMASIVRGKHVYVEKPLVHSIWEGRELLKAAQKHKVVTQMGNQGASMDCNRELVEWVQSGAIGDVTRAHIWTNRPVWPQGIPTPKNGAKVPATLDWDLWLGPAQMRDYDPAYLPFAWRGWWDYGTGSFGDMGCHLVDPVYRALKLHLPTAVEASTSTVWLNGVEQNYTDSCPPSSFVKMDFAARENMPAFELFWYDGGLRPMRPAELGSDEPFGNWDGGVLLEGSKGKMMCGIFGEKPTLLPTSRMKEATAPKPWLPRRKGSHQQIWADACKGNGEATSPFEYAVPLTETLNIGNLAVRCYDIKKLQKGKQPDWWAPYDYPGRVRLDWDAEKGQCKNFADANQWVKREYRKGWAW
ncbi:MAG: Gfo/Idh/MocA family oxidoreductase [Saprospiraceae bacterium]|nr:Gfo/Idh/MocA family oxidoreductase [Saprospiraceae bacterium]